MTTTDTTTEEHAMSTTTNRHPYNVHAAEVGDRVILARPGRDDLALTVWQVTAPGSGGRAYHHGPTVWARVAPGGYGLTFDAGSYVDGDVFHAD